MSPSILLPDATFDIIELPKSTKEKYNVRRCSHLNEADLADFMHQLGANIAGLDLNNISDTDVQHLKDAVWTHKVVIVKGQKDLDPKKQWELVTRFDPEAPQVHSHGDVKTFQNKGGMLSKSREVVGIPGAENVRL
ncbi:hypothetical protein LTR15_004775 [Elasticomyces elasticus]|nr:hypothetical protein LTR15_004775 [Elasticomyces elasticus]